MRQIVSFENTGTIGFFTNVWDKQIPNRLLRQMDLLVTSETVMYFKCPTDCLKLSQIVSFWTDIFQTSNIVSIFCLKLSQNKQGSTTGDIFRIKYSIMG